MSGSGARIASIKDRPCRAAYRDGDSELLFARQLVHNEPPVLLHRRQRFMHGLKHRLRGAEVMAVVRKPRDQLLLALDAGMPLRDIGVGLAKVLKPI